MENMELISLIYFIAQVILHNAVEFSQFDVIHLQFLWVCVTLPVLTANDVFVAIMDTSVKPGKNLM